MDLHEHVGDAGRGERVLLVDDEEAFRETMARALARRGLIVRCAESGEQCLEAIETIEPNVVVLDLEMPGMGGMAALAEIVRRRPSLPVIVLTGYGTMARGIQAMKAHAVDFLNKPVMADDLLAVIHAVLHGPEARSA